MKSKVMTGISGTPHSDHHNKETHQQMTEGASPPARINKVLRVDNSHEVILTQPGLFVLFPLELHPITVFT